MATSPNNSPVSIHNDHFDPSAYAKADEFERNIGALSARIQALEEQYGTKDKLIDTFCEASERDIKLQKMMAKSFTEILKDEEAKNAILELINKSDRAYMAKFLKGFGLWVLGGGSFIAGAIIQALLAKFIH